VRLAAGALPVDPEDNLALIRLHEGMAPIPRLDGVPEGVAIAVEAALSVVPQRRPRDAAVFGKLLAAAAEDPVPTRAVWVEDPPELSVPQSEPVLTRSFGLVALGVLLGLGAFSGLLATCRLASP
jgi:hypothetical protein